MGTPFATVQDLHIQSGVPWKNMSSVICNGAVADRPLSIAGYLHSFLSWGVAEILSRTRRNML